MQKRKQNWILMSAEIKQNCPQGYCRLIKSIPYVCLLGEKKRPDFLANNLNPIYSNISYKFTYKSRYNKVVSPSVT